MDNNKKLLDQLMGRDRDLAPEDKRAIRWDDEDICKSFLVRFCFHDLFVNTRADKGVCLKVHEEFLRKDYENSSRFRKMGYEADFLRECRQYLNDKDRKIERGRERLALEDKAEEIDDVQEKLDELDRKINDMLAEIERLGNAGNVTEAEALMMKCDELGMEKDRLKATDEDQKSGEKKMEICETCGAFLVVGDADLRLNDHLLGKLHKGYDLVIKAVDELMPVTESRRPVFTRDDRSGESRHRDRSNRDSRHRERSGRDSRHREDPRSDRHRSRDHREDRPHRRSRSPPTKHRR